MESRHRCPVWPEWAQRGRGDERLGRFRDQLRPRQHLFERGRDQSSRCLQAVQQPALCGWWVAAKLVCFGRTVDPLRNRIFVLVGLAGRIAAVEVRDDGLHTVWTAPQITAEFLALIGPAQRRVLVGTDHASQLMTPSCPPGAGPEDSVVWRNADTGDEIARSPLLSPVSGGTMVEPGYAGRMYFLADNGKIMELTARPAHPGQQ